MKPFFLVILSIVTVAAQTPPTKAPATPAKAPATGAKGSTSTASSSRLLTPALFHARAPELYRAKFTTTKGDFTVEVKRDDAPLGADRFYNLVKGGFFSGVAFYRVLAGGIVQFGLSPNPAITKAWSMAPIHDDPVKLSNKPATITFANAGPNTRTTQLFLNIGDMSAQLDRLGFAPIGTITDGMETIKNLYSGYGEMADMGGHGPNQDLATKQGKAYLEKNFPNLDTITSAAIIFPEPTPAPATPVKKSIPAKK